MNKEEKRIVVLGFLIFLIIILSCILIKNVFIEIHLRNEDTKYAEAIYEKNKTSVFRLSKLVTYSGAEAKDNGDKLQDFNISQYSDIALYIDNKNDIQELTEENTIKELYIDNFQIKLPSQDIGERQSLYYKNPLNIGKFREYKYDKIDNKLEYDIIYTNSENDEELYNTPVFYTDCTNPISISYINENIYKNYSVPKNSSISYDGRVLKDIKVKLKNITPKISFTIHIKNNLDEEYVCNFGCKINLENDEGSIYSGYFIEIKDDLGEAYKFFKIT